LGGSPKVTTKEYELSRFFSQSRCPSYRSINCVKALHPTREIKHPLLIHQLTPTRRTLQ